MSSDETFNCVFCKETFTAKETLQEHFRKHGDPIFDQNIKRKNEGENADKINVSANERVQCDVCDEEFPTISKAITHKHKAHPDHNTKYFCSWCGKLFTMKHLYNKHYVNHENMEPGKDVFHCDHCNVDFYKVAAMLYHNKSVHKDADMPDIGHSRKQKLMNQDLAIVYYCPFCGEEDINKVNVNKHISDDHAGENQSPDEVLRCPLCDAIFYHLDAYEAHLTYHSPDDIYNGVENSEEAMISEYTLDTVPPVVEKVEDAADEATSTLENLLGMADEDSTERRKHKKKHKKHKKSKKETITLDEFLSMSDVLGGEGLDIHGIELVPTQSLTKTFKAKPRPQLPKVNKKPMSQIDRLKQQGIIVKKANSHGNVVKPVPIVAHQTKVATKNSSTEVLSKLLNQSCSQLVISKKPATAVMNARDSHKDLSSPDLLNKSHESLEVECDLLPCSSSDIDQNDAINDIKSKEQEITDNKSDNKSLNSGFVASGTIENEKPDQNKSVSEEHKKIDSKDILKNLSHLITVKSVSKPNKELENNKKENISQEKMLADCDETSTGKKVDEIQSKTLEHGTAEKETNSSKDETQSPLKQIDCSTSELMEKAQPTNQDNNIKIEKKNSAHHLDILKGLGQNIVIKSSPKQLAGTANNTNDHEVLESKDNETGNNIQESVSENKPTIIENISILEHNSRVQQPRNNNIPDVIKNLCQSITIKSNNNAHLTTSKTTHDDLEHSDVDENSNFDENCEDDANFEESPEVKPSCSLTNTKPIVKLLPTQQSGSTVTKDQKIVNSLKNMGQNITVKPSLKKDNPIIKQNSTTLGNTVETKAEAVASKNLDVIKNLGKHITVKSSKPLVTCSKNKEVCQSDEEDNNLDSDATKYAESENDTRIIKPLHEQNNQAKQIILQNISNEITIKQASPKPQNTAETKQVSKPCMVNRPIPTMNKIVNKGICKNTEIFSIDDSDSDDIETKKSPYLTKNIISSTKGDVAVNRSSPAALSSESFNLKNVCVKPVTKQDEINNKAIVPVVKRNVHNDDNFDSDFEDNEQDESITNSVTCDTQKMLMNNKNITIKSSNSAQTKVIKNMSEKVVKVNKKSVREVKHETSGGEDNMDFPSDSDDDDAKDKAILQKSNQKSPFDKESVVNSFKDFDSDSNGLPHEDEAEDAPEEENSNTLINKLKNINKNLSIKSNNASIPITNKNNIELSGIKRILPNDSNSSTASKQLKVDNSYKNGNNKQTNNIMHVTNNHIRSVNHQASTSSSNKVQQKVTTSVRRIETETVVEEITTTVTRTIKTVNQTVNKQVTSGAQFSVVSEQPLRFASPSMISGPRPQQIRSVQGTRVRMSPPEVRPRMRPTRPVLGNNVRLSNPPQQLSKMPSAPRVRPNTPTVNVAPSNPGSVNLPRVNKPLRVSPNVMGQLNRANQSLNNDNKPGHFSCFRKPKEPVTHLHEETQCLPEGFSSVVQESNFTSHKKSVVKMDGAGTSKVSSEVSASAHQQIKKVNMSGVNVAKRSMTQQVTTIEQREMSSANRSTMDAIERLRRSGLLVKKPKIEEHEEEEMNCNSEEDDVPHEGPLLAIEDGT